MAAELTGTPTAISWGGGATPSAQNISIPSDCTAVYAFAGGYGGGNLDNLPTFTLAGAAPSQSVGKGGNPGTLTSGRCSVWYNPPTGTQSLTIAWDQAQSFGPCCIVAYVRGGDTTSWRDADAANAEAANAVSVTLTTVAGDLVLKFDQQVEGGGELLPPLSAGWTNGQTQSGQQSDSARLSYISASGTTQVCNCEEESYSLVLAVSIPAGSTPLSFTKIANLEARGRAAFTKSANLEARGRAAFTKSNNLEARGRAGFTKSSNLEARFGLPLTRSTNLEARGGLVLVRATNLEARALLALLRSVNFEAKSRAAFTKSANLEARFGLSLTRSTNLEAQGRAAFTKSNNLEARGRAGFTKSSNLEARFGLPLTRSTNLEARGRAAFTKAANLEALGRAGFTTSANLEARGGLVLVRSVPLEACGGLVFARLLPIESSAVNGLFFSYVLNIEARGRAAFTKFSNLEARFGLPLTRSTNLEARGRATFTKSANLEARGGLVLVRALPFEIGGVPLTPLSFAYALPIEARGIVRLVRVLPFEALRSPALDVPYFATQLLIAEFEPREFGADFDRVVIVDFDERVF